jgi:hypothetical protein
MSDRQRGASTGEWGRLRIALEAAGGGREWRQHTERTVGTKRPTIITYVFPDGTRAWRHASESKLWRSEPAAELRRTAEEAIP